MSGKALTAVPLMFMTPGILNSSYTCSRRQKPTRLPYSCQHQFGMSGIGEPPAGGVEPRARRGLGWAQFFPLGNVPPLHVGPFLQFHGVVGGEVRHEDEAVSTTAAAR